MTDGASPIAVESSMLCARVYIGKRSCNVPATIAAELGEAPANGIHYKALFGLGCILFIITMIINVWVETISKRRVNR